MTARSAATLLVLALLPACDDGGPFNPDAGLPAFDVTIGGVRLVANSGAAIANGRMPAPGLAADPFAKIGATRIIDHRW